MILSEFLRARLLLTNLIIIVRCVKKIITKRTEKQMLISKTKAQIVASGEQDLVFHDGDNLIAIKNTTRTLAVS